MSTATKSKRHRRVIDPTAETIITVQEAAERLAMSMPAMWRFILSGKIDSIKIGRSRRTSLEAIKRFIDATN